jgi:hypothetical protein
MSCMPQRPPNRQDDEDEGDENPRGGRLFASGDRDIDDSEFPDEADLGPDADDDTVPCPHCRKRIFEDSEWCPACGTYLLETNPTGQSRWILITIGALVGLLTIGLVMMR